MIRKHFNSVRAKWADMHPALRFACLLAVVSLVAFFALGPGYAAFKKHRLEKILSEAQSAVEESRMQEAKDLSLVVLRSGDPRIDAYRILEESMESLRDPRHGEVARALMFHEQGDDEDKLKGFQGIVTSAPLGLVGQAWAALPDGLQKDRRFAIAFSRRLIAELRWKEGASVLLAVSEKDRDGEWIREFINVLITADTYEAYGEAQKMIAANMTPEDISRWLDLLEKIPVLSLQGNLLLPVKKILESAKPSARNSLMLARMDYAGNFSSRSVVIDQSIKRWKDSNPEELASFLRSMGLNQLLVDTIPIGRITEHPRLLPYLLSAFRELESWEQVVQILEAHPEALPKYEVLGYRAIAAMKAGDTVTGVRKWAEAIEEAEVRDVSDSLLHLNKIALSSAMKDFSEKALIEAIRMGGGASPLYSEIKPLLISLKDAERESVILEICAVYLSFEPGNPVLLTQYAYLACLNELVEPSVILKALKPMAEAFPNELPMQRVLATVYLFDGQYRKARDLLEKSGVAEGKSPPEHLLALYAARVLTGQMSKDDQKITQIPSHSLLPSERKRYGDLIRTVK